MHALRGHAAIACETKKNILKYFANFIIVYYFLLKIHDKGPKPLTCHNEHVVKSQFKVHNL